MAVVDAEAVRQGLYGATYREMQAIMGGTDESGAPVHKDIHDWLEATYPAGSPAHAQLVQGCMDLEAQCRQILNLPADPTYVKNVPAVQEMLVPLPEGGWKQTSFKLRIWQLDFRRAGQVKSGASLHAVRDCLHKNLVGVGNETAKYPVWSPAVMELVPARECVMCSVFVVCVLCITHVLSTDGCMLFNMTPAQVEVTFDWPWNVGTAGPAKPGQEILPGSLAVAIGTATTLAAYLTVIFSVKLRSLDEVLLSSGPDFQRDLAMRLMKCLVIHGIQTASDNVEDLVMTTMRTKIQAAARTRPTPLQLQAMLAKLVTLKAEALGRVPREQLFREQLNKHNSSASAKTRIPEQEVVAVLLLDAAGPVVQEIVAMAWQAEAPPYSALPITLLNQSFLAPETALPVCHSCIYGCHCHEVQSLNCSAPQVQILGTWFMSIYQSCDHGLATDLLRLP